VVVSSYRKPRLGSGHYTGRSTDFGNYELRSERSDIV
jgi:hypothetical protein